MYQTDRGLLKIILGHQKFLFILTITSVKKKVKFKEISNFVKKYSFNVNSFENIVRYNNYIW